MPVRSLAKSGIPHWADEDSETASGKIERPRDIAARRFDRESRVVVKSTAEAAASGRSRMPFSGPIRKAEATFAPFCDGLATRRAVPVGSCEIVLRTIGVDISAIRLAIATSSMRGPRFEDVRIGSLNLNHYFMHFPGNGVSLTLPEPGVTT
ncbi:MAG TPA: hypothetical protein VFQ54_03155 [Thermomicrobiales bacterium]|nr:hypothetical protein [Thermomicrobiales bacterium]